MPTLRREPRHSRFIFHYLQYKKIKGISSLLLTFKMKSPESKVSFLPRLVIFDSTKMELLNTTIYPILPPTSSFHFCNWPIYYYNLTNPLSWWQCTGEQIYQPMLQQRSDHASTRVHSHFYISISIKNHKKFHSCWNVFILFAIDFFQTIWSLEKYKSL